MVLCDTCLLKNNPKFYDYQNVNNRQPLALWSIYIYMCAHVHDNQHIIQMVYVKTFPNLCSRTIMENMVIHRLSLGSGFMGHVVLPASPCQAGAE